MRKLVVWIMSTLAAIGILFGYSTSTGHSKDSTLLSAPIAQPQSDGETSGSAATSGSTASGSGTSSSSTSSAHTYTGDAVMTRYGNVQVQITVEDGQVTASDVTQVPWENGRDQAINSMAVPLLNQSAVQAQSAQIDMVSGATYTSQGYAESLQSALDQANL